MKNRSEAFGRLLKAGIGSIASCEGKKAPVIEEELGALAGVSGDTVQRYKSGAIPPDPRTVQLLAEAGVRRGFLGREWLQRFLHAARFPAPERLLDELCPAPQARPPAERAYHNLPAPTYSQFVMREQVFAEIADGLGRRSAMVVIVGLGGNGKTSIVREVAACALQSDSTVPRFDAVVWVSDKDRPGTTNLSVLLDEIARTLDYPGFTQFSFDEKRREVEQLLRRRRVLLVVDNFETVTDGALITWLPNLPEPSKAILTTREYRREFRRGGWLVELRGMRDSEVNALVAERLRVLRLDRLLGDMQVLEPLVRATGGNPKAIEITLGLVKYERLPLQRVIEDLAQARGELFEDLFARAWAVLDEGARQVLMVATLFPSSAGAAALSASAGVSELWIERALERLTDLALLDTAQESILSEARHVLHPLVRAFAQARLAEHDAFAASAREHWRTFFLAFATTSVGDGWRSAEELDRLEPEMENLHALVHHCDQSGRPEEVLRLVMALSAFWSFRGHYPESEQFKLMAIRAAAIVGDENARIELLCSLARAFAYQNRLDEAANCCAEARSYLLRLNEPLRTRRLITVNYSEGRVCLRHGSYKRLQDLLDESLTLTTLEAHRILMQYDLVELWLLTGRDEEARVLGEALVEQSQQVGDYRGPIRGWELLARLALQRGDVVAASEYLSLAEARARAIKHRRNLASIYALWGRLHQLRNDAEAAIAAFTTAADHFERMGMRRELAEVRAALAQLQLRHEHDGTNNDASGSSSPTSFSQLA
jgi:tetratricopeptide (TPR) repeat protein